MKANRPRIGAIRFVENLPLGTQHASDSLFASLARICGISGVPKRKLRIEEEHPVICDVIPLYCLRPQLLGDVPISNYNIAPRI